MRTSQPGAKLIFELTNLCNFSCVHCIREEDGPHSFLPFAIADKVLREVEPYRDFDFVAFTGGEPTLHPQFAEIAELVVERGYSFGFVTNGWKFAEVLPRIEPLSEHLRQVTFSLDGAREATHDEIRRRPGSFRRVMQAISLCRFHGIPFQINMVVTRANRGELQEMAELASRLGCQALGFGHCQPTPDGLAAGLVLDAAARRRVEAEVAELQEMFRLRILLAGDHWQESPVYQCPQLAMREFNIDYRGYLTACCTLSNYRGGTPDTDVVADLHEVSFYEAHRRLVARIAEINREKISRLAAGGLTEADHFICSHCLSHYGKVADHEPAPATEPDVIAADRRR